MTKKDVKILTGALVIIVVAIIISLVYAGFTGQLTINGTAVGRDSNWDIHFENVSSITTTGTAKVLNNHQPVINSNNRTEINDYEVSLTSPSDSISFTFDVVNDGNYNAKVTDIDVGIPQCTSTDSLSAVNMCNNLTYTLRYSNGATVNTNDVLYAKDKLTFKVTLQFNDISNPDLLPSAGVSIGNLGIELDFEQQGNALVNDDGTVANNRVYHIGDKITLNNEDYWVIENSGIGQDYVIALKDTPLTVAEVNTYGSSIPVTANNVGGYGGMAYGETADYETSNVKIVIDAWQNDRFQNNELKEIDNYKAKLIPGRVGNRELMWNYGSWWAWTTSKVTTKQMVMIKGNGQGDTGNVDYTLGVIRPFINVYKSAIDSNNTQ